MVLLVVFPGMLDGLLTASLSASNIAEGGGRAAAGRRCGEEGSLGTTDGAESMTCEHAPCPDDPTRQATPTALEPTVGFALLCVRARSVDWPGFITWPHPFHPIFSKSLCSARSLVRVLRSTTEESTPGLIEPALSRLRPREGLDTGCEL